MRHRTKSFVFVLVTLPLFIVSVIWADESMTQKAETFLQSRLQAVDRSVPHADSRAQILSRPDPGTFFLRYAFGLNQNAKKLLDGQQAKQLAAVLEQHTPLHIRWHDERNSVRCKFNQLMWFYAATSESEAARLRAELESWMRLRMVWTQQEHLAQYRFARDTWNVLTADQQAKLISGEWKAYAKQETGHTRADATAKIITRALGKPDNKAAFDAAVAAWSARRASLHAVVIQTETDERRIVFAMDLNNELMAYQASQDATAAYSALYLAEADSIRQIVQLAYVEPEGRCAKASVEAWSEADARFTAGASELIKLLRN